jgi:chorismate mutase / prephenate dehydratase
MNDLSSLRDAIDRIDAQVLGLLNERTKIAREIGRIKERDGSPVYVPERAEHLIARLVSCSEGPLGEQAIRAIYTEIMSAAIALEKEMVVACAGEAGGDAHFAARQQFGSSIRFEFLPDASGVVDALRRGEADCGVVAEREFAGLGDSVKEMETVATIGIEHDGETAYLVLGHPGKQA